MTDLVAQHSMIMKPGGEVRQFGTSRDLLFIIPLSFLFSSIKLCNKDSKVHIVLKILVFFKMMDLKKSP